MTMGTESLPFGEEAASTGIGGGNGSAEVAASDESRDPQVASSSEEEPNAGGYDERLRAGGEFAEQEVKNWERKFGKANSERETIKKQLSNVGQLLPIVDQLGGEANVIQALERFGSLLGDNKFKQVIESFESTGNIAATGTEGEEYADPEITELRGMVRNLTTEIQGLRGSSLRQDGTLAKQRITGHFQKALNAYPFNEEETTKIREGIETHIDQWSKNEQGVRALENLDERSVESLVRTQLEPDEWINVVRRMDNSRREEKRELGTDPPARTATNKAQRAASTALEACREAFKAEGLDPRERLI